MSCKFFGKVFNRSFNLRRHEREYCSLKDRSSQEMNFENDFSSDSTDRSESLTTTDNESESAEQLDPWIPLIEEAKQRSNIAFEETRESLLNSGLDEESATKLAYSKYSTKTPERTRKRLHARSHVDGTIQKGPRNIGK